MHIAFISDLHANFEALTTLADLIAGADKVVCLGDFIGYYCQVNEVLDFVRGLEALCVLGNHDSFLLQGCPAQAPDAVRFGIEYANRVITPEHRRWLENLPLVWGGKLDKCSVLLSHGSPWRPLDDYLYANNPALDKLLAFDYDLIAFGQTHRPLLIREQRPWRLNPGSVGQSRHRPSQACMALLDTSNMEVSLVERAYDSTNVIKQAGALGAGNWITKHLI